MTEPRSEVGRRNLVSAASHHLTKTVAVHLPFEALALFKTLLKQFFSDAAWEEADASRLSALVAEHVDTGSWSHQLDGDLVLRHGVEGGEYRIQVTGNVGERAPGLWDRVFEGPIKPEPTPHPLKVKFVFGGDPAPGVWYLADDREASHDPQQIDDRARHLLDEPDVTDVMVAGDFVTIGLHRRARWEDRLDDMLALVGRLFTPGVTTDEAITRDELVAEGLSTDLDTDLLHLLDPDDRHHRSRLAAALEDPDPRTRRIAVALLAGSSDPRVAVDAVTTGYDDRSLLVRRMAIDAAGDSGNEAHRPTVEAALGDHDPWTRWRAVRAIAEFGLGPSESVVTALAEDPDFQVRFEVARVLRSY